MNGLLDRAERGLGLLAGNVGPRAARLFHRALALCFLMAWLSMMAQVATLIGDRGLLPLNPFLGSVRAAGTASLSRFPSIWWWGTSDALLIAGCAAGCLLAVAALLGFRPRAVFLASTLLYLSYAVAGRTFTSFQWDNLLLECGLLAALWPSDRRAPVVVVLVELLLFKLYFMSGLAKWQSHLGDWHDGSAMAVYYETAPLPGPLAWWAHQLPPAWHLLESWLVLLLELVVPFAAFARGALRRGALVLLTAFQVANLATANYGFFVYLTLALHLVLIDDDDLARLEVAVRRRLRSGAAQVLDWLDRAGLVEPAPPPRWQRAAALGFFVAWVGISTAEGLWRFTPLTPPGPLAAARALYAPFRLVNTYHLFGSITRERIEPEVQTLEGGEWRARHLRWKPGDPIARPPLVAPHQPRLDFQLWFHGLQHQRLPEYAATLLQRLCDDPEAVAGLFAEASPARPQAARLAYWRYRFTSPQERAATGAWWRRELVTTTRALPCR